MRLGKKAHQIMSVVITSIVVLVVIAMVAAVIKGKPGNPLWYQTVEQSDTIPGGPFESSNNNSRYALVQSLAEDGSVTFNLQQARFAAPDMVRLNDKFLSIFMPGISFVAVPFYMLGLKYGMPQLFTFLSTAVFALINGGLIYYISKKLTGSHIASVIASAVFLIATNALVYVSSLTQHHGSTAVLLGAVAALTIPSKIIRNIVIGLLAGIGLLFDVPNVFMIAPIGLAVLFEHFKTVSIKDKKSFVIDFRFIFLAIGLAPMVAVFLWYNITAAGAPFVIPQMFPRSDYFDSAEVQERNRIARENVDPNGEKYALSTRQQLRSLYILVLSNERSWLHYSPVLLLGLVGIFFVLKLPEKQKNLGLAVISVATVNLLVYSMFGDPWGGWSFGARYLIPGAAMMAILLSVALSKLRKNYFFLALFIVLAAYSIYISVAGALTTATVPPRIEAEQMTTGIPYTYQLNFNMLEKNQSSSLAFNLWLNHYMSAQYYWYILTGAGVVIMTALLVVLWSEERDENR